ncbi:hypothetical protein [Bernardetia sp.]|uniref:hypothetical protein n=1 Tax=Bernardetia sp. TaxID=1937974 RepID=UPI0025BB4AD5|nr:hypothetical protein [Bernardetia sp.]
MKNRLVKFHFIILLILVVNFIITIGFNFGLNSYVRIGLKVLFYGSGLVGLVAFFRSFNFITAYFSLYVIFPILSFVPIVGNFIKWFFVLFISTSLPVYESKDYEIHSYYGIMPAYNQYEIYEVYSPFLLSKGKFSYSEAMNKEENESDELLNGESIDSIRFDNSVLIMKINDSTEKKFKLY